MDPQFLKKVLVSCIALAAVFALSHTSAFAYSFEVPLPSSLGSPTCINQYVGLLYTFALGIAGALAFGSIAAGGIKLMLAGGNVGTVGDAKEQIRSAVAGLLLLLFSVLILTTINPEFKSLKCPEFAFVKLPDPPKYHNECQNQTCVLVQGAGPNKCENNSQCQQPTTGSWCTAQGGAGLVLGGTMTVVPDWLKAPGACGSAGGVCQIRQLSLARLLKFRDTFRALCAQYALACDFRVTSTVQGPGGPSVSLCHKPDNPASGTCADVVITQCTQSWSGTQSASICLAIMKAAIESSSDVRSCQNEYKIACPAAWATGDHVHCNI